MRNPQPISAPWMGWKDDLPAMLSPSTSFKQTSNFIINKGRLYNFPTLNNLGFPPDGQTILFMGSFTDVLGDVHTLVSTALNHYYLTSDPVTGNTVYTFLQGPYFLGGLNPFNSVNFNFKLYQSGSNPGNGIAEFNGEALSVVDVYNAEAAVLSKFGSRVIALNLIEPQQAVANSIPFPNRVRWSKLGDGSNWNDISAGSADIQEIEDGITAFGAVYPTGFIFRPQGITAMSLTGNALAPFAFENFSTDPVGIGVFYAGSFAQFGSLAMFAGSADIYQFMGGQPSPVGGNARRKIMADLDAAGGAVQSTIITKLAPGIDYLSYWLCIPASDNQSTIVWIFHFDDGSWMREQLPFGAVSYLAQVAIA